MTKKKTPKILPLVEGLISDYERTCQQLAVQFLWQLELSDAPDDYWWVADEPGGVLCFMGGEIFVGMEEIILTLRHRLDFDTFHKWYSQWVATDFNGNMLPNRINLRSWINGARNK